MAFEDDHLLYALGTLQQSRFCLSSIWPGSSGTALRQRLQSEQHCSDSVAPAHMLVCKICEKAGLCDERGIALAYDLALALLGPDPVLLGFEPLIASKSSKREHQQERGRSNPQHAPAKPLLLLALECFASETELDEFAVRFRKIMAASHQPALCLDKRQTHEQGIVL